MFTQAKHQVLSMIPPLRKLHPQNKIQVTYNPFQLTCPTVGSQVKSTNNFSWWLGHRAGIDESGFISSSCSLPEWLLLVYCRFNSATCGLDPILPCLLRSGLLGDFEKQLPFHCMVLLSLGSSCAGDAASLMLQSVIWGGQGAMGWALPHKGITDKLLLQKGGDRGNWVMGNSLVCPSCGMGML